MTLNQWWAQLISWVKMKSWLIFCENKTNTSNRSWREKWLKINTSESLLQITLEASRMCLKRISEKISRNSLRKLATKISVISFCPMFLVKITIEKICQACSQESIKIKRRRWLRKWVWNSSLLVFLLILFRRLITYKKSVVEVNHQAI